MNTNNNSNKPQYQGGPRHINSNYNNTNGNTRYQQQNRFDSNNKYNKKYWLVLFNFWLFKIEFNKFFIFYSNDYTSNNESENSNGNSFTNTNTFPNQENGLSAPSSASISMASNPSMMNNGIIDPPVNKNTQINGYYNNNNRRNYNNNGYNNRMNSYNGYNSGNYFEDWSKPLPADDSIEK